MAKIYGTPIMAGGGGGMNKDLPPLLDNFKASVPVEGIRVGELELKTKIKLGKYDSSNLQWLIADKSNGIITLLLDGVSSNNLGNFIYDNAEPENPVSNRRRDGNNRYIYSNLHQWINSDKPANEWYLAQHPHDAPPDYQNKNGFLYEWNDVEKSTVNTSEWTTSKDASDGEGDDSFSSKLSIMSIYELGFSQSASNPSLQIFQSNADRATGAYYWTRTPESSYPSSVNVVTNTGAKGKYSAKQNTVKIRPICKISADVLVSPELDSDGCYTLAELAPVTIAESDNYSVTLSADKMEESRANELAGAVWVYGDHEPTSVNDGTKIQLSREEVVYIKPDFPEEPTEWSEVTRITSSKEYEFPEVGWFKIVAVAGGGNGGKDMRKLVGASYGGAAGGGGGTGGISVSKISVKDIDNYKISVEFSEKDIVIKNTEISMSVTSGGDGTNGYAEDYPGYYVKGGKGGDSGTASGGNLENKQGNTGSDGDAMDHPDTSLVDAPGGNPGDDTIYDEYRSTGGVGGGVIDYRSDGKRTDGSDAFVVILRGNTNISSQRETSINPDTIVQKSIPWSKTKDFYARQFTYNSKKQYQTMLEGALASVIVKGAPAQVTDLVVSGSGGTATLTWVNPVDDPVYAETVVVQKVGSAPSDITDGTEIYRGTDQTCTATGLEQSTDYYFAVYTLNSSGVYGQPVVSDVYSYDFPAEPTDYIELQTFTDSGTFTAPEDGWYRINAVGDGGIGGDWGKTVFGAPVYYATGGAGASPGLIVRELIKLFKGETIEIAKNVSGFKIPKYEINAPNAGSGSGVWSPSSGSDVAPGGKTIKPTGDDMCQIYEGTNGANGNNSTTLTTKPNKGPKTTNPFGYNLYGGDAGYWSNGSTITRTLGSNGFVKVYRGNTNNPSPSTASTLSLLPTDSTLTVDWENSGDPVQTGTMLVYNTNHVPTSANDGVSVDIPVTQATVSTFSVDGEEQQVDNKKQSYAITGLANNKPVYVALFPYDANKKYGIPKTDVEIPRVHSWYDTQQELQAEVETVKAEMADYQEYYVTTQEVLK